MNYKVRHFYMQELKDIESIQTGTRYWLVRTMGGDYYKDFVENEFIGIGYDKITIGDISSLPAKAKLAKKALQNMIVHRYENISNASYPASQMLKFVRDMKNGDVVVVPSSSSYNATFGVIKSDVYERNVQCHDTYSCPFVKCRDVEWIKTSHRHQLSANLQLIFGSRHIISEIKGCSEHIDSYLNDFYQKDDITYMVLRVKQEEALSADDFTLVADLMSLFNDYSSKHNLGITSKDIKMKISVQSPGDILVYAATPEVITVIGLIILFINGGTFKINWGGFNLEASSPMFSNGLKTLIESVNQFLNDREKRKTVETLRKKLSNMDIDAPRSLMNAMKLLGVEESPKEPKSIDKEEDDNNEM